MSAIGFVKRATVDGAMVVGVLALAAYWIVDAAAGLGVLAGGVLALGNLWWLAGRAVAATGAAPPAPRWSLGAVVRLAAVAVAVAVVLASGLAHPVAVVVGLTVLPVILVARGLVAAREV